MTAPATYAVHIRNRITEVIEETVCEGVSRTDAEVAWDGARRRIDLAQVTVIVNEQTKRAIKRQASIIGPAHE